MNDYSNVKGWLKYAKIDFFYPFINLWIAFNSWYESTYIKEEFDLTNVKGEEIKRLKEIKIIPWKILEIKKIIKEKGNKIIFTDKQYLIKTNFVQKFTANVNEQVEKFWKALIEYEIGNDSKYIDRVINDENYKKAFYGILKNDDDFRKYMIELRKKTKLRIIDNPSIPLKEKQEEDLYKYYYSIFTVRDIHKYLQELLSEIQEERNINLSQKPTEKLLQIFSKFKVLKRKNIDLYRKYNILNGIAINLVNSVRGKQNENMLKFLFNQNGIDDFSEEDSRYEKLNNTIDVMFPDLISQDNYYFMNNIEEYFLKVIYILRNKVLHGEFNPNEKENQDTIMFAFLALKPIFLKLIGEENENVNI